MFPQQVEALIKGIPPAEAKPAAAPAKPTAPAPAKPAPAPAVSSGAASNMVLTIDGQRHEVLVERLNA